MWHSVTLSEYASIPPEELRDKAARETDKISAIDRLFSRMVSLSRDPNDGQEGPADCPRDAEEPKNTLQEELKDKNMHAIKSEESH